jgi:ABC-type transport system involved in cytochrome c biogenesis permease subunit
MELRQAETLALVVAIVCYAAAAAATALHGVQRACGRVVPLITALGLAANLIAVSIRGWVAGRLPFASQYEFAMVFAAAMVAILYPLAGRSAGSADDSGEPAGELRELKVFVLPIATALLIWAALTPQEIRPLMPALRSGWLTFHVGLAAVSYASFAVAGGAGAMYLVRQHAGEQLLARLDQLQYRLIAWGYVGLTLTILTGSVWAYQAWGRYWGWDPKETWSLVTWIVYSVYLHLRLRRGWSRRSCAILSVAALASVIFTFIGVNLLLPGLHSYR